MPLPGSFDAAVSPPASALLGTPSPATGTAGTDTPPAPLTNAAGGLSPTLSHRKLQRPVRRMSKRDEILTAARRSNNVGAGVGTGAGSASKVGSLSTTAVSPSGTTGPVVDMSSYERVLSKNLTLTNELNDRESEIIRLKKQENLFEESLKVCVYMYEFLCLFLCRSHSH